MHAGRQAGITLLELLIVLIISSIAVLAMTIPFVAERRFWTTGKQQTEAQRDAQMVVHAIARVARQSVAFEFVGGNELKFYADKNKTNCTASFKGGPSVGGGHLEWYSGCMGTPNRLVQYVAGNPLKSRVLTFQAQNVAGNPKLVRVTVQVAQDQQTEQLETDLFLRNAS